MHISKGATKIDQQLYRKVKKDNNKHVFFNNFVPGNTINWFITCIFAEIRVASIFAVAILKNGRHSFNQRIFFCRLTDLID